MILKNGEELSSSTAHIGVIIDTCDFEDKKDVFEVNWFPSLG